MTLADLWGPSFQSLWRMCAKDIRFIGQRHSFQVWHGANIHKTPQYNLYMLIMFQSGGGKVKISPVYRTMKTSFLSSVLMKAGLLHVVCSSKTHVSNQISFSSLGALFTFLLYILQQDGFFRSLTLLLIELNTLLVFKKLWDGEHLRYLFHIYFNLSSLNEFLNIKVESSFLLSFLYPFLPSFYFFLKRNDYDHC